MPEKLPAVCANRNGVNTIDGINKRVHLLIHTVNIPPPPVNSQRSYISTNDKESYHKKRREHRHQKTIDLDILAKMPINNQ